MTIDEALLILDSVLGQTRLTDLQEAVFRSAWDGRTYEEISVSLGYDSDYIKLVGSQLWHTLSRHVGEKVTKSNFRVVLRRWALERQPDDDDAEDMSLSVVPVETPAIPASVDLSDAVAVSQFCGRQAELEQLKTWLVGDKCRMVAILGMGGIGKTVLSVKLAERVQGHFEFVIWRSLRDAPPIDAILTDLIQFLSKQQETELPETVDGKLNRLMHYLRSSRCLLLLDNAESILGIGDQTGYYPPGYEGYGLLFRRMAERIHQSCLVLTSREKPREVAALEGEGQWVRSLWLSGLDNAEVSELLKPKSLKSSDRSFQALTHLYGGNPLALKIVAATIQDLFDGNVAEFLTQGTAVFGDISRLLDEQFDRLSELEKQIMYWLTINRDAVSLSELATDLVPTVPRRQLIEALAELARRPLVERRGASFTQQPVVMEYVGEQLITQLHREILTEEFHLFMTHAVMKATVEDHIRKSQGRMIVQPLLDRLTAPSHCNTEIEEKFRQVLQKLREEFGCAPGYGAGNILNLLTSLKTDLTAYDFSDLAVWQAHLQGAILHGVNFARANLDRSVFSDTLGNVWSVAFSPDGSQLAASDTAGEVHVWRMSDGQKLMTCQGHDHWVCSVAFSPNGETLVSASADRTVKLWDARTGQCRATLKGHLDWVVSAAFHPIEPLIASSSSDRTIRLWDVNTGECVGELLGHQHWVCAIAFTPDGQHLVSVSDDRTVKCWNVQKQKCISTWEGHSNAIRGIAVSPNGKTIATGSEDDSIKLWDFATGNCIRTFTGHLSEVRGVTFSPDGEYLASASYDETVKLWEISTGRCIKTLHEHTAPVRSVAFSPDGELVVSGSADQSVRLWKRSGECCKTLQGYTNFVLSVAFHPTGSTLASTSTDHTVTLWDLGTGKGVRSFLGHTNWVWSVVFNAKGDRLASGSLDQTVRVWNVDTGECLKILRGHTNWVFGVAFHPDGEVLASGSFDQTIRLWDHRTGECVRILSAQSRIWAIAFNSDGSLLVSGDEDHHIQLWNPYTGQCLQTLNEHTARVTAIAFSPDGKWLVSASEDQTLKIWDVKQGLCVQTLQDQNRLSSVAFSPNQQTVISSGIEMSLKQWNLETGECDRVLRGHCDRVWSVSFSPNGRTIASGSEDETIRIWDVETGECLQVLRKPRPYDGMNISQVDGLTIAQKVTLKTLGAVENG